MKPLSPWYLIHNNNNLDTPALAVYPDRVAQNIRLCLALAGGTDHLRPHVKTHKSAALTRLLIASGISSFKCATIAEAEMLGGCSAGDVLLAYQPTAAKLARLLALMLKYPGTSFSCLVDNPATLELLSAAAVRKKLTLPVYIDLNIGMNRTGIAPGKKARELYAQALATPQIELRGLHAYDGHIHASNPNERELACTAAFAPVEAWRNELKTAGLPYRLIAGGTPTFVFHARREHTECSPGTFVYWDQNYLNSLAEQPFLPAALVLTRVISVPAPGLVCVDLGHKAIASENNLLQRVTFLNCPGLTPLSHSEEHLVLSVPAGTQLEVGDLLYGLPFHICPTIALYDQTLTIRDHQLSGYWEVTARKR